MILSIESSCDDSALALTKIEDCKLLMHLKISQELEHSKYGGVVPELASRLHVENLISLLKKTLKEVRLEDIKAIAVTTHPGLSLTLLEGAMMANTLSIALDIPIICVNHLKGHIYSPFIDEVNFAPSSVLLLSGGHSLLAVVDDLDDIKVVGKSLDDSLGESYDKVSKMLNLGYPGGPIIEDLASKFSGEDLLKLPVPLNKTANNRLDFSFSGLKNAVRLEIQKAKNVNSDLQKLISASFQDVVIKHLKSRLKNFYKSYEVKNLNIVGGVSANNAIKTALQKQGTEFNVKLNFAKKEFCSDNAAMIGRVGVEMYKRGQFTSNIEVDISPNHNLY